MLIIGFFIARTGPHHIHGKFGGRKKCARKETRITTALKGLRSKAYSRVWGRLAKLEPQMESLLLEPPDTDVSRTLTITPRSNVLFSDESKVFATFWNQDTRVWGGRVKTTRFHVHCSPE